MTQTAPIPHTPASLYDDDIERIIDLVGPLGVTSERAPHLRGAGRAIAAVVDHGPGIAADMLPRLFHRFVSGAGADSGTGLGLYFVQTVAEKHGGGVTVESVPNEATRFTLDLPLAMR